MQVIAHRLADDRAVVGMDERSRACRRRRCSVAVVTEHLAEARRVPDLAGLQVEFEQRVLRAGHGALEALLRFAQLGRLARDLVLRQLLVGDVPVDAEHADRMALRVAQDARVKLDVTDRAVAEQRRGSDTRTAASLLRSTFVEHVATQPSRSSGCTYLSVYSVPVNSRGAAEALDERAALVDARDVLP